MKAAWMVRSRQIAAKLSFWLMLIGYNPRDKSVSHRIYLIYAAVFMSLWSFAMLSLAAGATASLLTMAGYGSAAQAAAEISMLLWVVWGIFQLWDVSRRSPFVFSEEDAYLICQTPLRRSIVTLQWFVGDWLIQALPVWAISVIFGFAVVESQLAGAVEITDLVRYLIAGLRALSLILPLHLGSLALLWALGAARLQGAREWRWLPWAAPLGTMLAMVGLVGMIRAPQIAQLFVRVGHALFWPIYFALQAAFSISPWPNGAIMAMGIAIAGLVVLVFASKKLNLSRAAQESTQREKLQTAQRYGMTGLIREIKRRDRLGIGRDPTRLPASPGSPVLLWKDSLQSWYELDLGGIWSWVFFLATSLGLLLAPDIGAQILIFFAWLLSLGNRATSRLSTDLSNWWLLRSLPFPANHLLFMEVVMPWCLMVLCGWLAVGMGGARLGEFRLTVSVLIPPAYLSIGLVAVYDLLRNSNASMLLNGNVPGISWLTLLGGGFCLAILGCIVWWLGRFPWIGLVVAGVVSCLLAFALWRLSANKFRTIA